MSQIQVEIPRTDEGRLNIRDWSYRRDNSDMPAYPEWRRHIDRIMYVTALVAFAPFAIVAGAILVAGLFRK